MAFWVLCPFAILVWLNAISKQWSTVTRAAIYWVTLLVALGTLAVYADDARGHRRPQAAFVYVIVPPLSWLLMAVIIIPIPALILAGVPVESCLIDRAPPALLALEFSD